MESQLAMGRRPESCAVLMVQSASSYVSTGSALFWDTAHRDLFRKGPVKYPGWTQEQALVRDHYDSPFAKGRQNFAEATESHFVHPIQETFSGLGHRSWRAGNG